MGGGEGGGGGIGEGEAKGRAKGGAEGRRRGGRRVGRRGGRSDRGGGIDEGEGGLIIFDPPVYLLNHEQALCLLYRQGYTHKIS